MSSMIEEERSLAKNQKGNINVQIDNFSVLIQYQAASELSVQPYPEEEEGTTEDEMVGWHHQLDGHEFEQALGVGGGQGSLMCCGAAVTPLSNQTELN